MGVKKTLGDGASDYLISGAFLASKDIKLNFTTVDYKVNIISLLLETD